MTAGGLRRALVWTDRRRLFTIEPARNDPPGRAAEPAKPAQDEKWTVEPIAIAAGAKPEPAGNSYCYVCHANYEEEELTAIHHAVGVGCETCHGMSMKHRPVRYKRHNRTWFPLG
ncbi:MAG: cytochrome c family protein, partial [Thermoguttaceae bacterium]|nr:cytochrome c family protein [Thermoguttaceae bacterium]